MAALPLLLALAALPGAPPATLRALAEAPAGAIRAVAATAPLVGRPYRLSALGEGAGIDPDPRFRLDAFDCVTFVETAIALGNARDLEEAAALLDAIRYGGAPAFERRHHYVIPQWIPANLAAGWVEDVGPEVGGDATVEVSETFDEERWRALARAGKTVRGLPAAAMPRGEFRARVVPIDRVAERADRIPEGTIAWVVREDGRSRPTRVTHAGIVVVGPGGERRVRHATSSVGLARVVEEPLDRFLRRQARAWPGWPLSGVVLLRIRDRSAPR